MVDLTSGQLEAIREYAGEHGFGLVVRLLDEHAAQREEIARRERVWADRLNDATERAKLFESAMRAAHDEVARLRKIEAAARACRDHEPWCVLSPRACGACAA